MSGFLSKRCRSGLELLLTVWRSVPLDYFNESAGKAKIALGRFNATKGPRKGSLFINPGGPGGPGVPLATHAGPYMHPSWTYRVRKDRWQR